MAVVRKDIVRPSPNSRRTTSAADVVAKLEQDIASGALAPGNRLPPVRSLAAALGIAPNTASAAYRTLRDRGLVFSEGRRGTFVADGQPVAVAGEPPVPSGVADLANGSPDPALLPDLGSALAAVAMHYGTAGADHVDGRGIIAPDHTVTYGQAPIDEDLITAFKVSLEPDIAHTLDGGLEPGKTFAVVGGALDGIERTLATHLRPGDRVVVEDPAYTSVLNLLAALNLRSLPVAIDAFGVVPHRLTDALDGGAKAVILTPRAQNPTGAALDTKRAAEVAAVLSARPDVLIIEDDYAGPVAGSTYHSAIPTNAERWVVIRSVAKALGPDLRLAGLAGDHTTVGRIASRQLLGTGWVSHILQRTAAKLLADPAVIEQLDNAAARYSERRELFINRLADAGVAASGRSGLNVWVPVIDEAEVVAGMQAAGFAVRSGSRFRKTSQPAIRVTTAAADLATLEEAATALIEILRTTPAVRSV